MKQLKQFIQEHMATHKIYTKIITNKTNVFKAQEAQRLLGPALSPAYDQVII